MIRFVVGKPRGGKTLYALREYIMDELVFGTRPVLTNVALKLPELNEYLQARHPDVTVDLFKRVRILDDSQLKTFWKFRHWGENSDEGTLIALDEVHLYFNARKWMETGDECLHYLSQHGKLGDDVICITQHPENVDKQFRSVAEDYAVVSNGYTSRLGWFRGMPWFAVRYYHSLPTGSIRQHAFRSEKFQLDAKGIASCYDTAKGVGVSGRHADKKRRIKGLNPAWAAAGIIALALLGSYAANAFASIGKEKLLPTADKIAPLTVSGEPQPSSSTPTVFGRGGPMPPESGGKDGGSGQPTETIWVRGYIVHGAKVSVTLSDGRTLTELDDELESIRRNSVTVGGKKLYLVQAKDGPPKPSLPPKTDEAPAPEPSPTPSPENEPVSAPYDPWKSNLDLTFGGGKS